MRWRVSIPASFRWTVPGRGSLHGADDGRGARLCRQTNQESRSGHHCSIKKRLSKKGLSSRVREQGLSLACGVREIGIDMSAGSN